MFRIIVSIVLVATFSRAEYAINCRTQFEDLGAGNFFTKLCPANCAGRVCGLQRYGANSFVCHAAIHAGKIKREGGVVGIRKLDLPPINRKVLKNNVQSRPCAAPDTHSFEFADTVSAVAYYQRPDVPPGMSVGCGTAHVLAALDPCDSNPCQNSGVCINKPEVLCNCTSQFGGQHCDRPIQECYAGVHSDQLVKNRQMTSLTSYAPNMAAHYGRLDNPGFADEKRQQGIWAPRSPNTKEWFQVDFEAPKKIFGVITQGRPVNAEQWGTSYKIEYSDNGVHFTFVENEDRDPEIFKGNVDIDTHQVNRFNAPITARYWRYRPVTWHGWSSIRIEYLTC